MNLFSCNSSYHFALSSSPPSKILKTSFSVSHLDALEPYMSQRKLEVHWGGHHRGYVEALNKHLDKNDILYGCTMEELIKVTYNNGNPLPEFNNASQPLISLDLWEHAYYLDYKNDRGKYVNTFMDHLVSWNAAAARMAPAQAFVNLGEQKFPWHKTTA